MCVRLAGVFDAWLPWADRARERRFGFLSARTMQAIWMLLASLFFATMGVCIKFASVHFNSFEIVFYRGIVGVICLLGWSRARGGLSSLRSPVPMMHVWRCTVGCLALTAWFYAITALPLATAMTLNYMSSVWIALFLLAGAGLRGQLRASLARQTPLLLAILAGFMGVVVMLQPSFAAQQTLAALVGLLSGMLAALAYLQVGALAVAGEPQSRVVFYFSLSTVVAGVLGMAAVGMSAWHWASAWWLLPTGLLALGGQICMTRAYGRGATLVVANLQYSGIVFAALYGWLLFEEHLPLMGWLGMGLIVFSALAASAMRQRVSAF